MLTLVERLNWLLVGLAVLFLVFSIFVGERDSTDDEYLVQDSINKSFLENLRNTPRGAQVAQLPPGVLPQGSPAAPPIPGPPQPGRPGQPGQPQRPPQSPAGTPGTPSQQSPYAPPPAGGAGGLANNQTVIVSGRFRERLQSYQEAYSIAMEAGSMPTEWNGRPGREITYIEEGSLLSRLARLEPGDIIISINGNPIPDSPTEGRALYERLKSETTFTIELVRNGQQMTVLYRYQ